MSRTLRRGARDRRAHRGHTVRALVVSTATALLLSGCSILPASLLPQAASTAGADRPSQADTVTVTIQPLFVRGDSGGVGVETISRAPSKDGSFRIEFSEDEVSGLGDSSRAASWNAAIVSTLLTGQPLSGRFAFEIEGKIDGPSAGALKTVGLIAAANGDEIEKSATMTGTINATGTIGPVGGIPEKIMGASEAGIETVLIPLGQRTTPNTAGEMVDVVREGERLGVEVIEVGDVYEAYEHLTGEALEAPVRAGDPRLDEKSYDKFEAQVTAAYARYEKAVQQYAGIVPELAEAMDSTGLTAQAGISYAEAQDLQRQGMVAGAFAKAQQAAALMETVTAAAMLMTPLLTQGADGIPAILDQSTNTAPVESEFMGFLDSLGAYEPETLSDVEALVNAYAGAFDAYTMLDFANAEIAAVNDRFAGDAYGAVEDFLADLMTPLIYQKLAEAEIANAEAVFEAGRDLPGSGFDRGVDLEQAGDFFRRGAEANYAAFISSGTVADLAEANGISEEVVIQHLAGFDTDIGLATHQQAVLPAIEEYLGPEKPNAAYAVMGYGLNNYVRNQLLVEKYYNNAILDENFEVVGLAYEGALDHAIDLSRDQVAGEVDALRSKDVEPALSVGAYEAAPSAIADGPDGKFQALSAYSGAYVTTRLLSYLSTSE